MKKIIFFSKNLEIGGMEKALVTLLNSLINEYQVSLVLEEKRGPLLSKLNKDVKVFEYTLSKQNNIYLRKLDNLFHRIIWGIKNYHKYDFSCNYATYSIIGSRLAQLASKNSSIYIHSDYYNVYKQNILEVRKFFSSHKMKKYKKIIFVSNESRVNFEKCMNDIEKSKNIVINNLIDYENILKLSKDTYDTNIFNKKCINLLFVGRLDNDSKNLNLLFESYAKAFLLNDKLRLFIVGDGPYMEESLNIVKKLQIQNYVKFLGALENPYPYMANCDAVVLTSDYEGFPVIYGEALVLNKKVISTIDVSDDILNVKDFFTITQHDVQSISGALSEVDKSPICYNIDYNLINKIKIEKIKKVVEGK